MAKKLSIFLFRHGQTFFNRDKIFTGWKDSRLTKKGVQDAKKVAKKLKGKKFEAAFRTRLSRSKDTLKEVLKFHPECKKIITDDRMIERSYGTLEGKSHSTIIHAVGEEMYDVWHRSYIVPPPGGESVHMVEKRVLLFIEDLLDMMRDRKINVAISAHGNSMRPFRRYFEGLTVKEMMKLENPWDNYFEYQIPLKSK